MTSQPSIPPGVYRLTAEQEMPEARLDQFLADHIDGCSRGLARRLIEIGGVHLAGRRVRKCGQPVRAGIRIRWAELDMGRNSVSPWRRPRKRAWKISILLIPVGVAD